MSQELRSGDFLVFQLESAFGLLRVLGVDKVGNEIEWHLAAYGDFYPNVEAAEAATDEPSRLTISHPHLALTNRAFEGTQVARLANTELTVEESAPLEAWRQTSVREVSDRSIRLLLGLR